MKHMVYICNYDGCNKSFKQKSKLLKHLNRHNKTIKCLHIGCNKIFSEKSNLWKHMKTHKTSNDYICIHCGIHFQNSFSLKHHLETKHINNFAKYYCKICLKAFKKLNYIHLLLHYILYWKFIEN